MNSSSPSSLRTDYHVAQQTRRDKLRFDPPMFDFSVGSGDLHTALYKPDQFTTTLQSNPELLPYNPSSQLYQGHELAQMLLPVNQPPSLTLASNNIMTNTGPLGPFTGYATVIKGSRFLKPAQQLLEEFCIAVMGVNKGEILGIEELGECVFGVKDHVEGVSSSSLSTSTEAGNCGGNASKPEFEQKKAKLLYMQEEVCRRYKHYHQQMQMVVSSFESVPGLGSATPYTSLALKSISKHFRRLKTVISNQLKQISRMLGEEPTSSQSISRSATLGSNTRLPYMEHNHPVWRPQRGLPERAVSVLRAWLFEHFLHPYPTDADKHMLASQTGLSRNQVSNWFINARVRLWKPMVEEIHMLETTGKNSGLIPGNSIGTNKHSSKTGIAQASNIVDHNNPLVNCGSLEPVVRERLTNQRMEVWRGERQSRVQEEAMEENLISFGGYTDGKINQMGAGFGAVSLTLGLRHDGAHQQQQSRHFGVQMLHDFVG